MPGLVPGQSGRANLQQNLYAITEEGGQRKVRTLLQQLNQPNGVAVRDGSLNVAAVNRVLRYDGIEGKLDNPGEPADLTQAFNLRRRSTTAGSSSDSRPRGG